MAFVRILSKLLRDADLGKMVVPMVPDEARTFGMEALFRQYGIYSHIGQLYDPVQPHVKHLLGAPVAHIEATIWSDHDVHGV